MWFLVVCCVTVVRAAPHIVVIIADDLGWNDVSFHGSSQILTPNIDALAYAGVVLNRHYTMPTCSPSRAAFLTGRYPAHTGMQVPITSGMPIGLSLNFTLLPQYLGQLGYQSRLVGKWHLGCHRSEYLPTRRGFHSHFGFWNGFIGYYDGIHASGGWNGMDARRDDAHAWEEFVGHYSTDVLTQEAVSLVKGHVTELGPLYLQVALSAPHTGNKGSELQVRDLVANEKEHGHIADLRRRLYAGMVRGVDDAVGAILDALRSRDMLKDSIVVFTSDNGAPSVDPMWGYSNEGSNWPLRGMKASCHDGGVRTAATLWSPLVQGGRVHDQLVHMVDWLPTLYSAAGGNVKELGELDGMNQWESLRGRTQAVTAGVRTEMLVDLDLFTGTEAYIKWPWKIIKYASGHPQFHMHVGQTGRGPEVPEYSVDMVVDSPAGRALSLSRPQTELLNLRAKANIAHRCSVATNDSEPLPCDHQYCLFDLQADPCERTDLSAAHPSMVTALARALDTYRSGVVPRVAETRDLRAHPSQWSNYWTTWADDAATGAAVRQTPACLVVAVLLLVSGR